MADGIVPESVAPPLPQACSVVASASAISHSGVAPSALRTAMRASPPPSIVSVIFTQPDNVKSLPRSRR